MANTYTAGMHDCINKPKCEENNIIKLESGTHKPNVCRSRFQKTFQHFISFSCIHNINRSTYMCVCGLWLIGAEFKIIKNQMANRSMNMQQK